MLSGERIICFAPDPWSDIWRNRHRMLSILARQNQILYVEPRLAARRLLRKLRSGEIKGRDFLRPRVEQVRPGIHVYHDPLHLPRTGRRLIGAVIERRRDATLRRVLARLGFAEPILWIVRPDGHDLPGKFGEKAVLYQVVDDYLTYPGVTEGTRERLEREERSVAGRADLVVVTSETLRERKRDLNENMLLLRNGVDDLTVEEGARRDGPVASELAGKGRPIAGYVGGITEKLDFDLLLAVAERLEARGGTLALVGPVNVAAGEAAQRVERLRSRRNVLFTGARPALEVPSYLRGFDVGLIPYRVGDQSRAIDPLKLYEYLAFGKPTVSVAIPSVGPFAELVRIAGSREEFVAAVLGAAEEEDEELAARRRTAARENTWEKRVETLSAALAAVLARKAARVPR